MRETGHVWHFLRGLGTGHSSEEFTPLLSTPKKSGETHSIQQEMRLTADCFRIISTPRFDFNQDAVASLFAAHGTASVTRSTWVTCESYPQKHGPKWLRFDAWPIFLNPWRFRSHAAHTSAPAKNASAGHCQSGSVASEGAWWIPVNSDQLESWHLQGKSIARGTQKWMVSLQNPIEKWRSLGKSSPYFMKPPGQHIYIYYIYYIYILYYILYIYIILYIIYMAASGIFFWVGELYWWYPAQPNGNPGRMAHQCCMAITISCTNITMNKSRNLPFSNEPPHRTPSIHHNSSSSSLGLLRGNWIRDQAGDFPIQRTIQRRDLMNWSWCKAQMSDEIKAEMQSHLDIFKPLLKSYYTPETWKFV